jgi:predicted nucleic acid-binding protein
MRVFLDTWVLVERYKGNPGAIKVLEAAKGRLEAHISHITIAELVNVISMVFGEREALVQYAYLRRSPLVKDGTTEEISRSAGIFKTKYRFSLADALILATAVDVRAETLVTGGDRQYEEEWKDVKEIRTVKLQDFARSLQP